jgi:DNA-directed RNA polymerase specialized sigma24 family protein
MWRVVERLNDRQRTVFTLRYGKEQELGEIAQATGLHESSVKAHLWRAVARVREELGGRPGVSEENDEDHEETAGTSFENGDQDPSV